MAAIETRSLVVGLCGAEGRGNEGIFLEIIRGAIGCAFQRISGDFFVDIAGIACFSIVGQIITFPCDGRLGFVLGRAARENAQENSNLQKNRHEPKL